MASFQDKIGWKTQRKRENKNCRKKIENSKKIAKKLKKLKNTIMASFRVKNRLEKEGKEIK